MGDALKHLAVKHLERRCLGPRHIAIGLHRGNTPGQGPCQLDLRGELGETLPHNRVLRQRHAIALGLLSILGQQPNIARRRCGSLNARALERQRRSRLVPAPIELAEQTRARHPDVVKVHLIEMVSIGHIDKRFDCNARRLHIQEKIGNPPVFWRIGIGAGQHKNPVRMMRHTGPNLLATNDKLIAILHRAGLQRRQIRTGIGLAVALTPNGLAAQNAWNVLLNLLFCTVAKNAGAQKPRGIAANDGGICRGQLLIENKLLPKRPLQPAVLFWPSHGQPVLLPQLFGKFVGKVELAVIIRIPKLRHPPSLRQLRLEKRPDFLAKVFFIQ